MYESRTTPYTAQADVDATLDAKIMPDALANVVQFLTDQAAKPTKISFSEVPPEKISEFFCSVYGNPRMSFPPEQNV